MLCEHDDARTSLTITFLPRLNPNTQQPLSGPLIVIPNHCLRAAIQAQFFRHNFAYDSEDQLTQDPSPPGPSVD